jgi:hypothetical protein
VATAGMRDDVGARASSGVMGVDTHMILGVRACLTFAPNQSWLAYPDNPALCRGPDGTPTDR